MKRFGKDRFEGILDKLIPPDAAVDFTGSGWILTALNSEPPLEQTTITLDFVAEGKAAGSAGCNRYSTTYTQIEGTPALSFGAAAVTRKACADPVMQQERAYLQALSAVTGFRVEGQVLSLTNVDDAALAEFKYVSQEVAGSSWIVVGYNNGKGGVVSIISGTSLTADFGADGMVSGSSGCNSYSGPYTTDGDAISCGTLAVTSKMCFGEGVMEQEAAYLAALATAAVYKISGNKMELRREDGALALNLRRA